MEFPVWLYHAEHGSRIFYDEESLAEAGRGWADSPEAAEKLSPGVLKVGEPFTTTKRVPRGNRA